MAQSKELVLKLGGETYSLLEIPKSTSKMVGIAKQNMMRAINLPQLAKDLSNLGNFIRLAYNGVVGYVDLQIKVRKLFYDVVRLCDESVYTISEFQSASDTAIDSLQAAYQYLVDGLGDLAIINLEEIAEVAEKMQKAADDLAKKFEEEAKTVEKLENETTQTKSDALAKSDRNIEEKKQAEIDRKEQERIYEEMAKEEMDAEKEYQSARKKELEEIEKQKFGFFKGLINAITEKRYGKGIYEANREASVKAAEIHEKDKNNYYEEMVKAKTERRIALEKMANFAKRMEQLDEESDLESAATESLHHAATALASLADVMQTASQFWKKTQSMCKQISSPKMMKEIKHISGLSEEERRLIWDNDRFKLNGITYYSSWIAIKDICESCQGSIQDAQRQVHMYIRENPTRDQARKTVKKLAPELNSIIHQDIAALKQPPAVHAIEYS